MLTFTRLYDRCKSNWTQEFRTYFEQIILPLVDTDLGSWVLKKYDLFDAYSGIKGLICEPMQTVVNFYSLFIASNIFKNILGSTVT
jgi:hypothetical protein